MTEPPIEEVLDDVLPGWREDAERLARDGSSDEEIVAHFKEQMRVKLDGLLDLYNDLGQGSNR